MSVKLFDHAVAQAIHFMITTFTTCGPSEATKATGSFAEKTNKLSRVTAMARPLNVSAQLAKHLKVGGGEGKSKYWN